MCHMKKKIGFVGLLLLLILSYFLYNYFRIKYAKIEVTLVENLTLEFSEKKHVSDYITSINGKIIDDYIIDSTELGKKKVAFTFINDDHIKVKYSYTIEVVDTVEPLIWLGSSYSVPVGSDIHLTDKILCGDNYDNRPNCYIEGNYDLNTVGTYPLVFKAIDSSGNEESVAFDLNVYQPSNTEKPASPKTTTAYRDIVSKHKNETTKIGIDVSSWQGTIDFEKIKNAGVEFIMVRVGGTRGTNGEYFLDKQFKRNMEEANKYGINVGVYFYSYSDSLEGAKKDAEWVVEQIKDYKVTLPIAFDWEEWAYFNDYNMSFFGLTNMADVFLSTIEAAGYQGMLYSSKLYLEKVWLETDYDTWLAHYTEQTNYEGPYKIWQLCDNGKVDGIEGPVDINVMYIDN